MSVYVNKPLARGTLLTTSLVTVYTVPASTTTIVTSLRVTNVLGTPAKVTAHFVESGGTATAANMIFSGYTIPGGSFLSDQSASALTEGMTIQIKSDTSSALTTYISGVEIIS